jgi:hypothetical protein
LPLKMARCSAAGSHFKRRKGVRPHKKKSY